MPTPVAPGTLRRPRRLVLVAAAIALVLVALLLVWKLRITPAGSAGVSVPDVGSIGTAVIARRDLAEHETFAGTLGFADERTLQSGLSGTITSLSSDGALLRRGAVLYTVDEKPIFLMYGQEPAWRALRLGVSDGNDVRQLERNLVALGCGRELHVDRHWDTTTTEAVRCWQRKHRLAETGAVGLGEVAFLPGPRRIGASRVDLGARVGPGTPVMETSGATRIVTMKIDARLQALVHEGERVGVELPDGNRVPATISDVGRVAQQSPDQQGGPTIDIDAAVPGAHAGQVDQAPVEVLVTKQERKHVLTVPVTALVAAPGSGYLVETIAGTRHRFIRVRSGVVADGLVEVAGSGLRPGLRVVVAQ
jgi:peptidoglycan hydrolase-like protein with peptidoglycan-binding domain